MADPSPPSDDRTPKADEIAFDYIKTADFRSVMVEGALGEVTPAGGILLALYVERSPIPQRQIYAWDPATGHMGPVRREFDRGAYVREMSCNIVMEPRVAKELGLMLLRLVKRAEESEEKNREDEDK